MCAAKNRQGQGDGVGSHAPLAYETVVPHCFESSGSVSSIDFEGFPLPAPGPGAQTSLGSESGDGCSSTVRRSFTERGFSPEVANFLLGSWRRSTRRQYWPHIQRWIEFCRGGALVRFTHL